MNLILARSADVCRRLRAHVAPLIDSNAGSLRVAHALNSYGQACHESALLHQEVADRRTDGFLEAVRAFESALERLEKSRDGVVVPYAMFIVRHNLAEACRMLGQREQAKRLVLECWEEAGQNTCVPQGGDDLYPHWVSEWGLPLLRLLQTAATVDAGLPDPDATVRLWLREAGVRDSAFAVSDGPDIGSRSALIPLRDWLRGLRR
jgi:hypothetical protein